MSENDMEAVESRSRDLAEWLSYLESLHPKTIALGLERVAEVKSRLKLTPDFPIVVVGGTNGKGSVCAMLEAIFHAAGYRVGCYTSPHLLRYNERVKVSRQAVGDAALCTSFEAIERERGDIPLTYFEFGTLAAMHCFIEQKVEVAILEVGLGGRLDAVNVFDADCGVVTSIDIDHVDYLGDSREQIAFEKAGIFRAGKVAVFGDTDMPSAIAREALRIGASLWRLGEAFHFRLDGQQWHFTGKNARYSLPFPALRGAYQLNNASTVLAALDSLGAELPVSNEAVRRGLLEVTLPARFQLIPGKPTLILDVAHNPQAARTFARNLAALPPCPKQYAVIAMLKDKDMAGVIEALKPLIDVWLLAGIAAPRGATAAELAEVLQATGGGNVQCFDTVTEALHHACNQAGDDDRIAALGSFYTVAEVMRAQGLGDA